MKRWFKPSRSGLTPFLLIGPAVVYLFVWMIVPLGMTIYYSFRKYNLIQPYLRGFAGLSNYAHVVADPDFLAAFINTLILVAAALILTVVLGLIFAVLYNNENVVGRNIIRTFAASPFFIMPVVTGLIWKDLMMNPSFGLLAALWRGLGLVPVDFLAKFPMASVVGIVTWEWTPFAMLVLLASLSGVPEDLKEAASLDGAGAWKTFRYIVLPLLGRPLYAVVMLESIFFLVIFGQIYVTTSGGPGTATTNLPYYIYLQAFSSYDIGAASAGAIFAVILANIVAIFLVRMINANIQEEA
ncbi:carbohydrate ABC transporter permease [Salinisphaera sp. LB1]|uniref:carbohydrate ABC transporter permease n=1 Tax=Salinisphaera sp. LB1 TaxID=2183911 RepID=UPI000D7E1526|nr:sugar ABC transporter permease [Salinisphaera sp. LB1]AWN16070.1 Various polyols ABC transporter, permease component 1 [Salinisphaera sp. LB1]